MRSHDCLSDETQLNLHCKEDDGIHCVIRQLMVQDAQGASKLCMSSFDTKD